MSPAPPCRAARSCESFQSCVTQKTLYLSIWHGISCVSKSKLIYCPIVVWLKDILRWLKRSLSIIFAPIVINPVTPLHHRTVFPLLQCPLLPSPADIPLILPQNGWLLSFFCLPMLSWEIRAIRLGVLLTCRQRRESGQLGVTQSSSTLA